MSVIEAGQRSWWGSLAVLVAGDTAAIVGFVVAGFRSHSIPTSWFQHLALISAPFLVGWFAVAPFTGALRAPSMGQRGSFLLRSTVTWLLGIGFGLGLRATVFGEGFVPVFALVTMGVTGLCLLGWRVVFAFLAAR